MLYFKKAEQNQMVKFNMKTILLQNYCWRCFMKYDQNSEWRLCESQDWLLIDPFSKSVRANLQETIIY